MNADILALIAFGFIAVIACVWFATKAIEQVCMDLEDEIDATTGARSGTKRS